MEIVPGLHQIKTPMPSPALPYVLAYVLEGNDGVTLFDTGYGTPEATAAMTAGLKTLWHEPKDVKRVIVSHFHPDHLGMVGWFREQSPDVELVLGAKEWEYMAHRVPHPGAYGGDRKDAQKDEAAKDGKGSIGSEDWFRLADDWMMQHGITQAEVDAGRASGHDRPPGMSAAAKDSASKSPQSHGMMMSMGAGEPEVKLEDGEALEFDGWSFEAVWTPGHTPGHLCLYERNHRLMFTGDHVLPHITPNVSLHQDQEGSSPLADFRSSLRKVAAYDTALALPAHEFNIRDLPARAHGLIEHHDERLDEVRHAIGDSASTASDVSSRVHWNTGPFANFDIFSKRSALGETLSHLVVLEDTGRVRRVESDGLVLWEQI
ncbi:MAG: MBL fold metallo-hydrolase [Dehalococcoidia bacterium]|nr:MBL fold metallo-hydrolase [Dehalococcoidia bacterium]